MNRDRRVLALALLTGAPGVATAIVLLWSVGYSVALRWSLSVAVVGLWILLAFYLRRSVNRRLRLVASLLAALREGEYSVRAAGADQTDSTGQDDPWTLMLTAIGQLEERFRDQRWGEEEASNLLQRVLVEIDVAVFAFDGGSCLQLVNRAGEQFLGGESRELLGRTATALGLGDTLVGVAPRTIARRDPAGSRQWQVQRSVIRRGGEPLTLVALTDLSVALREEERQTWRRLVRVLSHEINNSLAPIRSIAASLREVILRQPLPTDWRGDVERGLEIVSCRSESLQRFMAAYSNLARLPPPELREVEIGPLVRRIAALETRLSVAVRAGPEITLRADPDQLEQALVNVIRNAADAAMETGGGVEAAWERRADRVRIVVEDEGPGLGETENLFVPFYSTKVGGAGIGLVLSQHIAQNHEGSLVLENRLEGRGARACFELPVGSP